MDGAHSGWRPAGPMGVGGVLDVTFRLYRSNFLTFFGVWWVLNLAVAMVHAVLMDGSGAAPETFSQNPMERLALMAAAITPGVILLDFVNALVITPLLQGATIRVTVATMAGEPVTIDDAYRFALGRLWPLVAVMFLVKMAMVGGFFLLVIPGIVIALAYSLAEATLLLEGLGIRAALGRSRRLTYGHRWRIFLVLLALMILLGVIQFALGGSLLLLLLALYPAAALEPMLAALVRSLLTALTMPLLGIATVVLYHDLRLRQEGRDLEERARSLEAVGSEGGFGFTDG